MPDDPRYEVKDDRLKDKLNLVAGFLDDLLNVDRETGLKHDKSIGFAVFLFEFDGQSKGKDSGVFYISNAVRADMTRVIREWLHKQGSQG